MARARVCDAPAASHNRLRDAHRHHGADARRTTSCQASSNRLSGIGLMLRTPSLGQAAGHLHAG
jgi:hypothetical protein